MNARVWVVLAILSTAFFAFAQEMATDNSSVRDPGTITGAGTKGHIPRFTGTTTIGNAVIFQNSAGEVGIGTTSPTAALDVNGAVNAVTSFDLGGRRFAFGSVSTGNVFLGFGGNSTTTSGSNTAIGDEALYSNTTGNANTAIGTTALRLNTTGCCNAASGGSTLQSNTTGSYNTAIGNAALYSNTTGGYNTASGPFALFSNTVGADNTASGVQSLYSNTTGGYNTASGYNALFSNTDGADNTAIGGGALATNTTGSNNTALGVNAGPDAYSPNLTNATALGAFAAVSESNALVLGGTGKYAVKVGIGTPTPANVFTIAQSAGHAIADGWDTYSSRRWKTNIQTLHGALDKIEQLRGVSYDLEANGKHEVGVIAEEVGAVVPEVVSWDKDGKNAAGVDYSRLTALLIEATKEQQNLIRKQQKQIETQQAEIAHLASQIRSVQASFQQTVMQLK